MARRGRPEADGERIEERRRQILHAAAAVFARRGYHRARTREIADEAGIAEGTIYNYFSCKRDLLLALLQRTITESVPQALADAEGKDLRSLLAAFLRDRLKMLERNRAFIKAVVPEMITDKELRAEYLEHVFVPVAEQLMPLARQAVATGQVRPVNPRVALPAVLGAVVAAFVFNEVLDIPLGKANSLDELADDLAHILVNGLQSR